MTMSGTRGWTNVAAVYSETFAHLCAGTLPALLEVMATAGGTVRPRGGAGTRPHVLDVGAGTGALVVAAAATGARVTAVEPDPGMAALTRVTAGRSAEVLQAELPRLPLRDDSFDVVLANFVVNHLPHPAAGVAELARVAAPGAAVAATIWPTGQTVQSRLWAEVVEASGAIVPPTVTLPADKDFPRTEDGLGDLFRAVGLEGVATRKVTWTYEADPQAMWRGAAAGIGGIGQVVTAQAPAVRDRMHTEYQRRLPALVDAGRLRIRTEALLAVGSA